jgi:hypothetical protein
MSAMNGDRFTLEESVNCYLSLLGSAYNKLKADAERRTGGAVEAERLEQDWKNALAGLYKTLPRGFLRYLRTVVRSPLRELSQDESVGKASREQYQSFFQRTDLALVALRSQRIVSGGVSVNPDVARLFRRGLQPLLVHCYGSMVTQTPSGDSSKVLTIKTRNRLDHHRLGEQYSAKFMRQLGERHKVMAADYLVDNSDQVAMGPIFEQLRSSIGLAAQRAYPGFLQAIEAKARLLYENQSAANTASALRAVVVAYDAFFVSISPAIRAYLEMKYCMFGGVHISDCHMKNTAELADLVTAAITQHNMPPLTEVQFDLLDNLGTSSSIPFSHLMNPENRYHGFFGCLYGRLQTVVVTAQRQKYLDEERENYGVVKSHLRQSVVDCTDSGPILLHEFRSSYKELKSVLYQIINTSSPLVKFFERFLIWLANLFPQAGQRSRDIKQERVQRLGVVDEIYKRVSNDGMIVAADKCAAFKLRVRNNLLAPDSPIRLSRFSVVAQTKTAMSVAQAIPLQGA